MLVSLLVFTYPEGVVELGFLNHDGCAGGIKGVE